MGYFNPFSSGNGGGGGGFTPTSQERAALDSGITSAKVQQYDDLVFTEGKTGYIPPEPTTPEPREEVVVDITNQVNWVPNNEAGYDGYGYSPSNYDDPGYAYDHYKFVKTSYIIELNPQGDDGYDFIETTFPAFRGSSNTPGFNLVFLSELPEGYSDEGPSHNPGWPAHGSYPDTRMVPYITGTYKNQITAANPLTGEVKILRLAIPEGTKYVKVMWYTDIGLSESGLVHWNGTKPLASDFYLKKIKSGTIFDITDQFTSWRTGNVMAFTNAVSTGNYYVKNDTTIFDESDAVKIQDNDNEFQKLRVTIPQYTDSIGSRPKYAFVFLTEIADEYDEDDWYVADPSNPAAGPFYNQTYIPEQYSYWVDKAPTDEIKHGAIEEVELVIPPTARYVKALWFTDTFTNWDGHGEVQFSCKKIKELDHPEIPKQVLTTEVYSDPMNNSETTLNDGHSSDKIEYRFVVVLPKNYSHTGKSSKVLMIAHGGTGEVQANGYWYPGDQEDMYETITMFRENGYVIFDVDKSAALNYCYGDPVMLEAYYNAFKYIKENYNVEDTLNIYAMSMGTNTAFNFINLYRQLVKAVLIAGPRTGVAGDNVNNYGPAKVNFGLAADESDADVINEAIYPFNILAQIIELPNGQDTIKSLTRNIPPTKIIARLDDRTEATKWVTGYDDVTTALHNGGNFVVARTVDTTLTHGELCHLYDEDLRLEAKDWFDKYGK